MPPNPFSASHSTPGSGLIVLGLLPPGAAVLQEVAYQYPLKLIAPAPLTITASLHAPGTPHTVHTVFLLTYGGGLVAGDAVDLRIRLGAATRLCLLTQGSTKIFKRAADSAALTRQHTGVALAPGAALCYLPDPVQPFADSAFAQRQTYNLVVTAGEPLPSLCVLDWVSEGRPARGEAWAFRRYASRNEVVHAPPHGPTRLLLRDAIELDATAAGGPSVAAKVDGAGAFGSLILCGGMFEPLGEFFMAEFAALPRIGAKDWDAGGEEVERSDEEDWRAGRVSRERADGVLWTAARTRGFVVVKFSVKRVEGGKRWLSDMLRREGTVARELGERALLCLK